MSNWTVIYTRGAARNLDGIYDYIAFDLSSPEAALRTTDRLETAVSKLEIFPFRHPVYPHEPWYSRGVRYFTVDHFIILYYPDDTDHTVTILRIMYYRQSPV